MTTEVILNRGYLLDYLHVEEKINETNDLDKLMWFVLQKVGITSSEDRTLNYLRGIDLLILHNNQIATIEALRLRASIIWKDYI